MRSASKKEWGTWSNRENQRKFLLSISSHLKIQQPCDWGSVTLSDIVKNGGSRIASLYGSPQEMLKYSFPEVDWKREWFYSNMGIWRDKSVQKDFLSKLAKKFQISTYQDWGKISAIQIENEGGKTILRIYNFSVFKMLSSVFDEIKWNKEWFFRPGKPSGFWSDKINQRIFLQNIAKQLKIKTAHDWKKLTWEKLQHLGGRGILCYHQNSVRKAVIANFPELDWKSAKWKEKTTQEYWNSKKNQESFLENIANQYGIKHPSEWNRVTKSLIITKGGKGLLEKYNNSLLLLLQNVFPQTNWNDFCSSMFEKDKSRPHDFLSNTSKYMLFGK